MPSLSAIAVTLRGERVVEGDEVQQAPLRGGDQPGPVPAPGDRGGVGAVSPGLGVPAVPVERQRQVQLPAHRSTFSNATG